MLNVSYWTTLGSHLFSNDWSPDYGGNVRRLLRKNAQGLQDEKHRDEVKGF